MACDYTNYAMADDEIAAESKKKELVAALKVARLRHGEVPFLLETLADYTSNISEKLVLLDQAFRLNIAVFDYNEALSCANSALRAVIENKLDTQIEFWRSKVGEFSLVADDPDEVLEAKKLLSGNLW